MSNSTKKNKKKINVIDVMIILLVLALIGTAAYRIYTEINERGEAGRSDNILTFECTVAYRGEADYLKSGDAVYLVSDGALLGYLYDPVADDGIGAVYEITESETEGESGESESLDTESESNTSNKLDRYISLTGKLKLSADAVKASNGNYYILGGKNITIGSAFDVYTESSVLHIVVKNIESAG